VWCSEQGGKHTKKPAPFGRSSDRDGWGLAMGERVGTREHYGLSRENHGLAVVY
jgi:hypothetical protein